MSKNLIPKIAKMFGVELGEKFKIKGDVGTYEFGLEGLWGDYGTDAETLEALVCGGAEIVKLLWKPKFGDRYFSFFEFNGKLQICRYDIWRGTIAEEAQYRCGWVFRTREEAEAALPKVAKEMEIKYEI